MSARDAILRAVRAARPAAVAPPDVAAAAAGFPTADGDLAARFAAAARAGGSTVLAGPRADVAAAVARAHPAAARVLSTVADVPGTMALPEAPHAMADLDVLVCEAELGVAENGAVWLPESRVGHRAALFLAAHVVAVLDRRRVVADLHAAYAAVDVTAGAFGAFVAGPSKTADIEQSLVIGAHGPLSFTILLVDG